MSARGTHTVASAMTTELQTVGPRDRLDVAGLVMQDRRIRQLLVVDDHGRLLGMVSYRALLRLMADQRAGELENGGEVRDYMVADRPTVSPATPLRDAIRIMLEEDITALAVVDDDRPVGILSEHDVARVAGTLLAPATRPEEP